MTTLFLFSFGNQNKQRKEMTATQPLASCNPEENLQKKNFDKLSKSKELEKMTEYM